MLIFGLDNKMAYIGILSLVPFSFFDERIIRIIRI